MHILELISDEHLHAMPPFLSNQWTNIIFTPYRGMYAATLGALDPQFQYSLQENVMFIIIVSGKGRIHFPRASKELNAGDLLLNPSHCPFRLTAMKKWTLDFIAIQCNLSAPPLVKDNQWLRLNVPQIVPFPTVSQLKNSFSELQRLHTPALHQPYPGSYRFAFNSILQPLISWYLVEGFRSGILQEKQPIPDPVLKSRAIMSKELIHSDLTVEEIARRVGLPTRQFIQEFRKHYHDTPAQYLHKHRVQKAVLLLQGNPDITLEHIAHRCGYKDRSSLHRQFKKYMGISPGEYRKTS